jgi:bifunctional pyridoxal-dependent enzyme with beta-cystathionase and maltose regulon repressor activities
MGWRVKRGAGAFEKKAGAFPCFKALWLTFSPFLNTTNKGGTLVPYMLDESKNWALSIDSLRSAVQAARAAGKCVRGLVFINPGNPTGQCLSADNLRELIK